MRRAILVVTIFLIPLAAAGQSTDVAFTGGGYFAVSNPLSPGVAFALEGSVAHRIVSVPLVSLDGELPIAGSFESSIPTLSGTSLARSYTSLFITPGLRVRLAPSFPLSPYVSAGLGWARFNRKLFDGTTAADNTFAFDIGGGLDFKVLPYISLRAEVRDFNSGGGGLETLVLGRQNNVFVTAGLAVHF